MVTGTTTGKLVLWDCLDYTGGMNKKESYLPKLDISRQTTQAAPHREPTRATSKSSGSTRSGTLSSRKSSAKTHDNDEENYLEKPTPLDEHPQEEENKGWPSFFSPLSQSHRSSRSNEYRTR